MTWKNLCVKHDYGRAIADLPDQQDDPRTVFSNSSRQDIAHSAGHTRNGAAAPASSRGDSMQSSCSDSEVAVRPKIRSYKSHFKQRYLVEAAWKGGGTHVTRHITQEGGVVTSLHLTSKYIIVALDNAKIHVFDAQGQPLRTLQGHVMGVWAMVPWDDILVSGGCDRDVRVWDLTTG